MSGGTVSVVIPAFNAAATIRETLESVRGQSYHDLDIVVVDDGSRDATPDIVAGLARLDPRLRLIRQANAGTAAARNAGIRAARGGYVAPLDADDLWHPDKILRQVVALARAGPKAAMAYCWVATLDEHGRVVARNYRERYQGDVYAALVVHNVIGSGSTPLIRRDALLAVGGYDPELRPQGCADLKLYLAIAERWQVVLVPEFLVGYRQRPDSQSEDTAAMRRSFACVMAEVRQRHPELPGRLFRWADGNLCYWMGARSLRRGDWRTGAPLIAEAVRRDPALVAHPMFRRGVRKLLRGRHGADGVRPPFLSMPPDPTLRPAPGEGWLDAPGDAWLSPRRRAWLERLRIVRPEG